MRARVAGGCDLNHPARARCERLYLIALSNIHITAGAAHTHEDVPTLVFRFACPVSGTANVGTNQRRVYNVSSSTQFPPPRAFGRRVWLWVSKLAFYQGVFDHPPPSRLPLFLRAPKRRNLVACMHVAAAQVHPLHLNGSILRRVSLEREYRRQPATSPLDIAPPAPTDTRTVHVVAAVDASPTPPPRPSPSAT